MCSPVGVRPVSHRCQERPGLLLEDMSQEGDQSYNIFQRFTLNEAMLLVQNRLLHGCAMYYRINKYDKQI